MLAWQDGAEWRRDNRWQDIGTAPEHQPVDVFAKQWGGRGVDREFTWIARRFLGCTRDGQEWSGLPAGWLPTHWTDALTAQRIRALTR